MSETQYLKQRPQLSSGAQTLPAHYYADPKHFRTELERIHFSMWLWAGREERIPEPGDYFLLNFAGESVIVTRTESGKVKAYHNVCRHRGTRLCKETSGKLEGGKVRCPYHAWAYSCDDGRLVNAVHMDQTEGFQREEFPLHALSADTWDGHIFVHFDPQAPPLADHLLDIPERFRAWNMAELQVAHRLDYVLECNWKLVIQNYSECLHCPIIHPQLQQQSHYLSGENAPPQPTYLGGRMDLRDEVDTLTMDGKSPWKPLPGLDAQERRGIYYWSILPNLLLNLHPDYMLTFQLLPLAHDRTRIVCEFSFHPDEIVGEGFDPSAAVDFWDLTNRQDWEVSELAQLGISSSAYTPGPYSNREELLHALDQFVLERLED